MDSNIEQIKKAIEIEAKYKYTDIRGRTKSFSAFIRGEIRKFIKTSNMPERWKFVLAHFEQYSMDTLPNRKKSIEYLINTLKSELTTSQNELNKNNNITPFSDVTYIKGVGPKVASLLNKLGIFTASDLLFYIPRKHIDYSKRTLIKYLQEGEDTTIIGYIKQVEAFTTPKGLAVIKVKIQDESGSIILNFFFGKSNKYMLERTKSQFPKNAGIIISGTVKINSYDKSKTLDNITYSIMSEDFLSGTNLNIGRIVPIYPLCENMNIKTLRKAIYNAIQLLKDSIVNVVPEYLIKRYNLLDKKTAIEQIHFPDNLEMLEKARFTLVFEEFFLIQLKLAQLEKKIEIIINLCR